MKKTAYALFLIPFVFLLSGCQQQAEAPVQADVPPVVWTVNPVTDKARHSLTLTGVLKPLRESAVGFQVAGRIVARAVEVGDTVRAGDVLYRLDDRDYRLALNNLQAQLRAVDSDLQTARKDLVRLQDLLARKLVSQQQVDAAQNRVVVLEAQRQSLLPQIETARNRWSYTVLKASADGVVMARQAEVGQVVTAGTPVMTLGLGDETVLELDWPNGAGTPPATLTARLNGQEKTLSMAYAAPAARPTSHTRTVRYHIGSEMVAWGQILSVVVRTGREKSLWRVPVTAVQMEGKKAYLFRVNGQQVLERVPVTVERVAHDVAWVQGPLTAKDRIVRMGVHVLRPGQTVRVGQP
ncbi:membrane fusion protein, multidrug efflux system [Sulfurivirga caldicuralii]|uniref:Membrane fusion protein, multidrug efflux system n=1 Tax=Sulfurivirga caldicuralii TaxID=364032 RepID=A0A1N6F039_9GAMM|nr:efflux RND transporter periplasmic adaptor subunit [Sulfurivirga caldicuralii]SIN88632.1 membrane fusion protein, multidrug efflux system [Sulfurivirga caldicuralii]